MENKEDINVSSFDILNNKLRNLELKFNGNNKDNKNKINKIKSINIHKSTSTPKSVFKSVVKIFTVKCKPHYTNPWQMRSQNHSTSSGFIISNKRIMCNAHGVSFARSIRIRKYGESKKYQARIEYIGHECDLAILKVDNQLFWKNVTPLTFSIKQPKLQDTVVVVGYPVGGDNICVTKGVVSRIGFIKYTHAGESLLGIQIDAAINSGNSGGPTMCGNEVIGVAFSGLGGTQNIGYIIPNMILNHFLNDIELHGKYTSFPKLGIQWQKIESKHLKEYLKMNSDTNEGVLILKPYTLHNSYKVLKKGDVLLKIDNVSIGEDGTIPYMDGSRISFNYLTIQKFVGDTVKLEILRDGVLMNIDLIVTPIPYLVPLHLHDILKPKYFIFGGLVFVSLSVPYLKTRFGNGWISKCSVKYLESYYSQKENNNDEIVVLSCVLAHDINFGYHKWKDRVLLRCNDIEIKNLKQLCNVIDNATTKHIEFALWQDLYLVLNRQICIDNLNDILKQQQIKHDRSENLRNNIINDDIKDDIIISNNNNNNNNNKDITLKNKNNKDITPIKRKSKDMLTGLINIFSK